MRHASDCATNNGPAFPTGECDCGGVVPELPTVNIDAISKMADALIERSSKFAAFFSRAELEAHLVFGVWPIVLEQKTVK